MSILWETWDLLHKIWFKERISVWINEQSTNFNKYDWLTDWRIVDRTVSRDAIASKKYEKHPKSYIQYWIFDSFVFSKFQYHLWHTYVRSNYACTVVKHYYLQMQQTPKPAAQDPWAVPPRDEHSDAVIQVLEIVN